MSWAMKESMFDHGLWAWHGRTKQKAKLGKWWLHEVVWLTGCIRMGSYWENSSPFMYCVYGIDELMLLNMRAGRSLL